MFRVLKKYPWGIRVIRVHDGKQFDYTNDQIAELKEFSRIKGSLSKGSYISILIDKKPPVPGAALQRLMTGNLAG